MTIKQQQHYMVTTYFPIGIDETPMFKSKNQLSKLDINRTRLYRKGTRQNLVNQTSRVTEIHDLKKRDDYQSSKICTPMKEIHHMKTTNRSHDIRSTTIPHKEKGTIPTTIAKIRVIQRRIQRYKPLTRLPLQATDHRILNLEKEKTPHFVLRQLMDCQTIRAKPCQRYRTTYT